MSDTENQSDKTKSEIRAEKRAAREERKKIKENSVREMQDDQIGEIEDLADDMGLDADGFVIVKTDEGVMACKKASSAEMERFNKAINAPAGRRGKRKGPSEDDSIKALVRSARFYPSEGEFEQLLASLPICWNTLGDGLVDLAGASFEADVRKN